MNQGKIGVGQRVARGPALLLCFYQTVKEEYPSGPTGQLPLGRGACKEVIEMAKIDRWLSKEGLQQVESWAAACTDQELAGKLGVTRSTLALWKKTNSDISDAISRGRADVHACENVEKTLLDRALGYTVPVKKAMKVRHVKYNDEGRRVAEDEEIVLAEEEQHIPADVGAIRFFLTNRAPGRWQNKVEMEAGVHAEGFEEYLERREREGEGANY